MKYELKDKDYLELWQYFEDRATSVKGAMFNTITWIIGFAAALLAFIFAKITDFEKSKTAIPLSTLMILVAIAGLVICLYAFFALGESAKHINNNWEYSKRCRYNVEGLCDIVLRVGKGEKDKAVKIWNRLAIVVWLFVAAFVGILIWSFNI